MCDRCDRIFVFFSGRGWGSFCRIVFRAVLVYSVRGSIGVLGVLVYSVLDGVVIRFVSKFEERAIGKSSDFL